MGATVLARTHYGLRRSVWGGVDTTFALYRPMIIPYLSHSVNCRVAGELTVTHAPWYIDSQNRSEEENYYIEHCKTSTHWSGNR